MGSHPGSNIPSDDYSRHNGLFLSVDSPSQCHGNVTHWNFCYKRSTSRSITHSVLLMTYRQRDDTLVYDRLPSSLTIFEQNNLNFSSCMSIHLNATEQFEIQPNDIIGVCMRARGSIDALYVSSNTRKNAIRVSVISDNYCEDAQLSSLNFNSLERETENYLLVEVLISKSFNILLLLLFQ